MKLCADSNSQKKTNKQPANWSDTVCFRQLPLRATPWKRHWLRHKQIDVNPLPRAWGTGGPSSYSVAGDAISGQLARPACFLQLSIVFPAGDTPELICPPEHSESQAEPCAPTMAFPSAPSALWIVSLLTVLFTAVVHSSIVTGKHIHSCSVISQCFSEGPWPPRPSLSVSGGAAFSVDSRLFFFFGCCCSFDPLYYEKKSREALLSTWDAPTSLSGISVVLRNVCVTCTWVRGSALTRYRSKSGTVSSPSFDFTTLRRVENK